MYRVPGIALSSLYTLQNLGSIIIIPILKITTLRSQGFKSLLKVKSKADIQIH